ncbi:hypothetical protein KP806_19430 [Paenibacillus sp. N4]|uniref:hypothetical protein n=1 Tax=Paenibacillus vietnamensis TaxID=2590547 RepID=UPI001CD104A5|nr:hypothetical protein [Paenibacillus vietnamensis]MCA0757239.1 hypothetical protein [Paenibacillus vietnamensis]
MTETKRKFSSKAGIIGSLVDGLIMAIPMGMMGQCPELHLWSAVIQSLSDSSFT